jgi:hypothetical protein
MVPKQKPRARGSKSLIKTSINLEAETLAKLKEISRRTMIPMASLIRKGIETIITEYSAGPR